MKFIFFPVDFINKITQSSQNIKCALRVATRECKWLLLFKIILKFSNSLCFSKIFKFPVFSQSGITFHNFPCAVGTLPDWLLIFEWGCGLNSGKFKFNRIKMARKLYLIWATGQYTTSWLTNFPIFSL